MGPRRWYALVIHGCLAGLTGQGSAAEELVVLQGGVEIVATIISMDSDAVVLEADGLRVTFDRGRVVRVGPAPPRAPRPLPAAAVRVQHRDIWSLDGGIAAGWVMGSITSTGSLSDAQTASGADLEGRYDLDGLGILPGLWFRLLSRSAEDGGHAVYGLRASLGTTQGADARYGQQTLGLTGGWAWNQAQIRYALLATGGYALGRFERTLTITAAGATETADASTKLAGWMLGLSCEAQRRLGPWHLGLSAGMEFARLDGDGTWRSQTGRYVGTEHLEVSASVLYAAIGLGVAW